MTFILSIFLLLNATFTLADQALPTNTPSRLPIFHLLDLQPVSTSFYRTSNPSVVRYYFQFRNQRGNHFIVYEEEASIPPVKEAQMLRESISNWNSSCSIDLDCTAKPYCTNECKNMYYQISNTPANSSASEKDKCKIASFTCSRIGEPGAGDVMGAAPAAPASIPASKPVETK